MANEFKIKNGLIVSGSTEIEQNLTVYGTFIANNIVSGSSQISFNGITDKPTLVSGSSQIIISGTTGYSTFSSSIDSTISSSIAALSASIASTDLSDDNRLDALESTTASLNSYTSSNTTNINAIHTATSSLNTFTSSANGRLDSLESASGSIRTDFNSFTSSYTTVSGSLDSRLDVLEAYSGSQLVPSSSMSFRTLQTDVYCKNVTGVQINKGTVVRIVGATGDNPLIAPATLLTEGDSANTLGIATQNIPNDSFGLIITEGVLTGVNTDGMTAGALLFLGANGTFTTTAPVAPNHGVRLGEVLRVQQNNGSIYVRIDNGIELNEAHDVIYSSISHGDLLFRSGSVWKNSKALEGNYRVTGSLTITQNLTVLGSSSITYVTASQLAVSSSVISVNVFEPAERFGGLKVYDSGSSTATASLLWDSEHNHWIYQNVSGANYSGGMLLSGPRNTGSLGDEPGLINGRIVKSIGGDHLDVSIISETGTTITIAGDLVANSITGAFDFNGLVNKPTLVSGSSQVISLLPSGTVSGSSQVLSGTGIWSGSAQLPSGVVSGSSQISYIGLSNIPTGIVSGSSQITYGSISGTPSGIVSGSVQVDLTATTNYSSGIKTRLNSEGVLSGSAQVVSALPAGTVSGSSQVLNGTTIHSGSFFNGITVVSGSGQISFNGITDKPTLVSGSSQITYSGISGIPSGIVSGSSQITFGSISGIPSGLVSGSSQISFGSISGVPSGLVSGSSQITNIANSQLTNSSFNIGTTSISLGRTSASQTLTGVSIDGNAATATTAGALTSMNISQFTNNSGYITGINSSAVTTALGYTPYNATNPNGYITGISFANVSSKPTTISGYGITDAITTGNIGSQSVSNAATVASLTPFQFFNNMGQNHSTQTDFNSITNFGFRFVQGSTNGPGTGSSQFYGFSIGLGNDYAYSDYALQLAIPRYPASDKYITFRTREATTWGSWNKISAGYADSAGSVSGANVSGNISGNASNITSYTINQSVGTSNTVQFASLGVGVSPAVTAHFRGSGEMVRFENTSSGTNEYTQLNFKAGTRNGYIWLGNQNSSAWAGAGGLNIYTENGHMDFWTTAVQRIRIQNDGHMVPFVSATYNLGSSSLRWNTVFTSDLSLSNGIGDYTIVEGEEKLYLYNNKNNKVYSFVLQEEDPATATPKKS